MGTSTNQPTRWKGLTTAALLALILWGCTGDDTGEGAAATAPTGSADGAALVEVTDSSFANINDMTPVRGFFVDNLLGDLDATLEVANSTDGGVYPVGTLIQLVPGEAMVKQPAGFSPGTRDWEFFGLDVSETGTTIRVRGGVEVVNRFGLSCADCHAQADPEFDFICEQTHGCDPLPISRSTIEQFQRNDPRPVI